MSERDLDSQIAEMLFGWQWFFSPSRRGTYLAEMPENSSDRLAVPDDVRCSDALRDLPLYSLDDSAAEAVIDYFIREDWSISLRHTPLGWRVDLGAGWVATDPSRARAVCLCAVEAKTHPLTRRYPGGTR